MLRLAIVFLVIGLIAGLFGFGLVSGLSFEAAKILFFVFIVLAVLSLLGGVMRRPPVRLLPGRSNTRDQCNRRLHWSFLFCTLQARCCKNKESRSRNARAALIH